MAAHKAVNAAFELARPHRAQAGHPATMAWRAAIAALHDAIGRAYPDGFQEEVERLKRGDAAALESVIGFLEADPMFFRSGYAKAVLVRLVCRFELRAAQTERLRRAVLEVVDTRASQEFRHYCRLARKLGGPWLLAQLQERLEHANQDIARRARWMLENCDPWPD